MNQDQVRDYVSRYLEAAECQVIEHHPAYMTVKLSPEADKALTNRPYYWSFVERTGAEPETMTITFVFDQEAFDRLQEERSRTQQPSGNGVGVPGSPGGSNGAAGGDSILARYFGISPGVVHGRARHELVSFGSGRLNQIFASTKDKGRVVHLYEQPEERLLAPGRTASYVSYLAVNYKIEYICDIKRDELHSLGICLSTGEILTNFHERLVPLSLTPRLPAHMHINDMLSLPRAVSELEAYLERYVKSQDHRWAELAEQRMNDELDRIKNYYQEMIQQAKDDEERMNMEDEYRAREQEIAWQHKPRVLISAVNCGIFHLLSPM